MPRRRAAVSALSRVALSLVGLSLVGLGCGGAEESDVGAAPAGPAARTVGEILGVAGFPGRGRTPPGDAEFHARATREAGVTWVRDEVNWARVQPERDRWDWEWTDGAVEASLRDGKRVIALLAYGNRWAAARPPTTEGAQFPPDDPADFAAFAATAVRRYKDRVHVWEVWNEENSFRFWQPTTRGDPAAYARLLVAAHGAIKAEDAGATVLFGGLFFHDQGLTTSAPDFLDAAHAAAGEAGTDLAGAYDGLALHPYDIYPPRRAPESAEDGSVPLEDMIRRVRDVMGRHGAAGRDVWVTEFGWPVFPGVTEEAQAAYLARSVLLMAGAGVRSACWYTLWDGPRPNDFIPEDQFGLLRWQDAPPADREPVPKPAYDALAALAAAVGDLGFVEDRTGADGEPPGERVLVFGDEHGRRVTAAWDPAGDAPPVWR